MMHYSPPLVVRFGAMGDMVLLTVLIRALHARFGQPVDIVASARGVGGSRDRNAAPGREPRDRPAPLTFQ